jgi:hypothetical protein
MITYREVKSSPSGWPEETTDMSFESELTELIYSYRNVANKHGVSRALTGAADIVEKDEGWIYDETNLQPEPPTLEDLEPDTAVLGDPDFTLSCIGTGFDATSVINFAGQDEPTTLVSDTEVTTIVKPSLPWGAVGVPVFIKGGGAETDPIDFTFTDPVQENPSRRK